MTDTENASSYTRKFWAKSEPRYDYPKRIHLLEHHLADVGACFEALLGQSTIRQRLARSGGLDSLDETTAARLSLLAALHDIGKVNMGFQTQIWRDADFPGGRRRQAFRRAGHYRELAPVLTDEDSTTADWFFDNLGLSYDTIKSWDMHGGETVCALFVAALSHHGQPLQLEGSKPSNRALWERYGNLTPSEGVRRIGELARQWFPAAWEPGGQPLPSRPEFQHHFLGLCTLADWIGSNERWFPFCDEPLDGYMEQARRQARDAIKDIGLDVTEQRGRFTRAPGFSSLFPQIAGQPNAVQQAAYDTPLEEPLVIIESETGSGKTEAALWRFARMYEAGLVDGLYFALPTRAAAKQLHGRIQGFTANLFPEGHRPPVVLAVPGYRPGPDAEAVAMPGYNSHAAGHHDYDRMPWAAESAKRYLAAQIAVGTVDQAMMAALKVRHSHMRAACLARNLLVVDEVHASDAYMRRILKALLDAHLDAGGYALLMSATLGSVARQQWLSAGRVWPEDIQPPDEAVKAHYPAVSVMAPDGESIAPAGENGQGKCVAISAEPVIHDFGRVAETALDAARAGAKALVIRNTVSNAVATQEALEQNVGGDASLIFSVNGIAALHHSRFAADDRHLLDSEVERRLDKNSDTGGLVIVGTQTLEQSLDIDADLLITDLCPVDVLLQRIGRLHRHRRHDRPAGYDTPRCIVLTPDTDDLSPLLRGGSNRTGLGPHGYVYEDLRVLEATRRLIRDYPEWRIPEMNRLLVESATHSDALKEIEEMGPDWLEHGNAVFGENSSDRKVAESSIIQRGKSFYAENDQVIFDLDEGQVRTRLGDLAIEVEFVPPPPSVFDESQKIDCLSLPVRWLGRSDNIGRITPTRVEGGFTFAIGDVTFRYDRLGLRKD